MVENNNGNRRLSEVFRWLTPILLTTNIAILSSINTTVSKLDDKVFKHMTNDEIHAPRSNYVNKSEFDLYQKFRDNQMARIDNSITEIRDMLREHMKGK